MSLSYWDEDTVRAYTSQKMAEQKLKSRSKLPQVLWSECLCPPKHRMSNMVVLGGRTFGWSHEAGTLMRGILVLENSPLRVPSLLPVCEDTVQRWPFMNQEVGQTSQQTPDQLVPCPNHLSFRTMRNFCCLQVTQSVAFCYSSQHTLRQWRENQLTSSSESSFPVLQGNSVLSPCRCSRASQSIPRLGVYNAVLWLKLLLTTSCSL